MDTDVPLDDVSKVVMIVAVVLVVVVLVPLRPPFVVGVTVELLPLQRPTPNDHGVLVFFIAITAGDRPLAEKENRFFLSMPLPSPPRPRPSTPVAQPTALSGAFIPLGRDIVRSPRKDDDDRARSSVLVMRRAITTSLAVGRALMFALHALVSTVRKRSGHAFGSTGRSSAKITL